ncbi:hypothetical protein AO843_14545 [Lysinibacillus sp. ZYM-1]|nr:hypothetical protein AO843_14545 [Lysinibacillus sp. ZYM-1]
MLMVLVGDFIGKTIFAPAELPVGIVISIIGVPYFVYLLFKKESRVKREGSQIIVQKKKCRRNCN